MVVAASLFVVSCSPKMYETASVSYGRETSKDSIAVRDCVIVRDVERIREVRDTIFVERLREHIRDRWRERIVRDTVIRRDSCVVVQTVTVPAQLTKWQKFRMDTGGWALGAVAVLLVIGVARVVRN